MRARNIKPGFFKNELLVELPFVTRLFFIGLWTLADREGRIEDREKKIKIELFPADNVDIEGMLNELHGAGFVHRYVFENAAYIQIMNFKKHQHPHIKEPASTIPAPDKPGASPVQARLIIDSLIVDSLIPDCGYQLKEESKTQAKKTEKAPPRSATLIVLPDFVSAESWDGFLEMRKQIRKPATDRAKQMLIKKLVMLHNAGHDANEILDQSTVNGWQDLYEMKTDTNGRRGGTTPKTFGQIQLDNIKNAMRGAMNDETGLAEIQFIDG